MRICLISPRKSYLRFVNSGAIVKGNIRDRVTISGKAKIGTMDGDFSRDQIYGHFNFYLNKSGTLRCSSTLDHGGKNSAFER